MVKTFLEARPWIVRSRAWISILGLAPFAALAAVSAPLVKEETLADFVLDAAGWLCFYLGAMFRWWATLYIGGRKKQELVTAGPYSITRNPLYLGTFLITCSIALFLHSLIFAIGLMAILPVYLWITIPWEEKILRGKFTASFDDYQQRVPKFLPRLSQYYSPRAIQVKLNGLKGECLFASRWMWVPLLAQAVAHLRWAAWWPILLRLP